MSNTVDVMAYLLDASHEERAALLGEHPEAAEIVLQEARQALADASPLGLAQVINQGHRDLPHLDYLDARLLRAVRKVEAGQSQFIRISMPPRSGKSVTTSEYLPLWLLKRHPEWRVGLISHAPGLAAGWGRTVRRMIEDHGDTLGLEVARDAGSVTDWETTKRGGISSRSVGQSITGRGFKVMIVDDVVKDYSDAASETRRQHLRDWWQTTARTRLEPPGLVIVIGCLTAESPVLLADGTERPISEVRPGDLVMTYEDGRWTTAPIVNWANVGPDHVYTLRMESGREVRGNAKHPFLVLTEEGEQWRRMDSLRPGDRIVSMPAGGPGAESSAHQTTAPHPSAQRVCASSTTTPHAGPQGTDATPPSRTDALTSDTGTASTPRTMTRSSPTKAVSARSADVSPPPRTPDAKACCSPTTITTPVECAASCATTATSSSATVPPSNAWSPPSPTSDVVQSITLDGYEDVYDIEVERTHNFVVNSLATHNTRWHEDDFTGWVDTAGDPFETIIFEAIATEHDDLGREPGDPLYSPFVTETREEALARWAQLEVAVGPYAWAALYQQDPQPAGGSVFKRDWFRYWTRNPDLVTDRCVLLAPESTPGLTWLDSWDVAIEETDTADYTVGQRWARDGDGKMFLIAQTRQQTQFPDTLETFRVWAKPDSLLGTGRNVYRRVVERAANGYAVINTLEREIPGVEGVNPKGSKEVRANAVTPEVAAGMVFLPNPSEPGNEWVHQYLDEMTKFPNAKNDDQVDSTTQALLQLRIGGGAHIQVPGDRAPALPATTGRTISAARTGVRRSAGG